MIREAIAAIEHALVRKRKARHVYRSKPRQLGLKGKVNVVFILGCGSGSRVACSGTLMLTFIAQPS